MKGMKKKGRERGKVRKTEKVIIAAIILVAFVGSVSAATLTVTPDTAVCGALVTVEGEGFTPNAPLIMESTTTCEKPVVSGKCECSLMKFNISNEETSFSLSVREVKGNVVIHVKKFLIYWTIDHNMMGFNFVYDPITRTATVTRGMPTPTGVYEVIDVIGNAVDGATTCTMTTTITKKVMTDGAGGFKEAFDTHGIPAGIYTVTAGGTTDTHGIPAGTYTVTADGTTATLNLTTTPEMPGGADVSKDGYVGVYDCVCIARYDLGVPGYDGTTLNIDAADVNGDGVVDLRDARCLARLLIGLPCS